MRDPETEDFVWREERISLESRNTFLNVLVLTEEPFQYVRYQSSGPWNLLGEFLFLRK